MRVYNYEVYLSNPKTGESGWDIQMVSVFGNDKKEARKNLKKFVPNFDSVILFNWSSDLSEREMEAETLLFNSGISFFYTDNNQPILSPTNTHYE